MIEVRPSEVHMGLFPCKIKAYLRPRSLLAVSPLLRLGRDPNGRARSLELFGQLRHAGIRDVAIRVARTWHGGPTGLHEHVAVLVASSLPHPGARLHDLRIRIGLLCANRHQGGNDLMLRPIRRLFSGRTGGRRWQRT